MSELQELYEKVTKASKQCQTSTCKGCPCRKDETKCTFPKDNAKLIELQHAEIKRLMEERKEKDNGEKDSNN